MCYSTVRLVYFIPPHLLQTHTHPHTHTRNHHCHFGLVNYIYVFRGDGRDGGSETFDKVKCAFGNLCSSLRTRFTAYKLRLMVFYIYYVCLDGFCCCWHLSRREKFSTTVHITVYLQPISTWIHCQNWTRI